MSHSRKKLRVLVGMSGGVDSSVAAALLVKQGYEVIGGFIKNWSDTKDLQTGECAWKQERRDAVRVAATLGIPLLTFDYEKAYKSKIVKDLFAGYAAGITPNPDVLCNEVIKFGLFFDAAQKLKADFVATGHYAQVKHFKRGEAVLLRGADLNKDQSYFLYRVSQKVLAKTLFPIGHLRKTQVRSLAKKLKLPVADKPDSQGICFIGKINMGEFLRKKIPARPGPIVDDKGNVLGEHQGLDQYTIGQRQNIRLAQSGHAWFVARKNYEDNILIVVPSENHPLLFSKKIRVFDLHWIAGYEPRFPLFSEVQVRYRQNPTQAKIVKTKTNDLEIVFKKPVKACAPGQSAVFYQRNRCLGGGVIVDH